MPQETNSNQKLKKNRKSTLLWLPIHCSLQSCDLLDQFLHVLLRLLNCCLGIGDRRHQALDFIFGLIELCATIFLLVVIITLLCMQGRNKLINHLDDFVKACLFAIECQQNKIQARPMAGLDTSTCTRKEFQNPWSFETATDSSLRQAGSS